jgi:hypothetical protein
MSARRALKTGATKAEATRGRDLGDLSQAHPDLFGGLVKLSLGLEPADALRTRSENQL